MRKRPVIASNRRRVILLHDNARPYVARVVHMGSPPTPSLFTRHCTSDYHMFRSMQYCLEHAFETTKNSENGSMNGSLQNQSRSIVGKSNSCQKDGKKSYKTMGNSLIDATISRFLKYLRFLAKNNGGN